MNDIISVSKLAFFKAERYEYKKHNTFDTSSCPRPHFCMGLVLSGCGSYTDCENNEVIRILPGDIIFVPVGARYISNWSGTPEISYISMHFLFESFGIFSRQRNFRLQKVHLENFEEVKKRFEFVLENYDGDECEKLGSLSVFYGVLKDVFPILAAKKISFTDTRLDGVIEHIEKNFLHEITIEELAGICNMSVSRFFPAFKKAFDATPVEYINNYRISRAIILMMNHKDMSIERISEEVGFESSAYFRRVFKKVTGKSPREYRKTSMEM